MIIPTPRRRGGGDSSAMDDVVRLPWPQEDLSVHGKGAGDDPADRRLVVVGGLTPDHRRIGVQ